MRNGDKHDVLTTKNDLSTILRMTVFPIMPARYCLALCVALGCGGESTTVPIPAPLPVPVTVTSVSVSSPSPTVASGASIRVAATVQGSNGALLSDRVVSWQSSNSAIATVDSAGTVTAGLIRGGASVAVTITATAEGRSGTTQLEVLPVPVASVRVSPSTAVVRVGQQLLVDATPLGVDAQPLTGRPLVWRSLQSTVATVDAQGRVRAVSPGVARIEVQAEAVSAHTDITVPNVPDLTFTVSAAPAVMVLGDQITLAWSTVGVDTCESSGAWGGTRAVSGSTIVTLDATGVRAFVLRCSGAGGDVQRQISVTARRPVSRNSYENFKHSGVSPSVLPRFFGVNGYGDFFGTGTSALFTAELRYDFRNSPESAPRAELGWWTLRPDRTWLRTAMPVTASAPSCVHPRKVLTTDLNNDRRPDIVLICHGYDGVPFSGEQNLSIVSQSDGQYVQRQLGPEARFFHGGATCELDGDAGVELITADGKQLRIYDLNADGSATYRPEHFLSTITGTLYSVECLDLDEDGRIDVVAGGHEPGVPFGNAATRIWFGGGGGAYRVATIPAVSNEGTVLDFTITGSGLTRTLWVLRTSGGDGTAYVGNALQRVHLATMSSTIVFASRTVEQLGWVVPYERAGATYLGAETSGLLARGGTGWELRISP